MPSTPKCAVAAIVADGSLQPPYYMVPLPCPLRPSAYFSSSTMRRASDSAAVGCGGMLRGACESGKGMHE
jgi:hypothetical protein